MLLHILFFLKLEWLKTSRVIHIYRHTTKADGAFAHSRQKLTP